MFHVSDRDKAFEIPQFFLPNDLKRLKASSVFRYQSATDGRYRGAIKTSLSTRRHGLRSQAQSSLCAVDTHPPISSKPGTLSTVTCMEIFAEFRLDSPYSFDRLSLLTSSERAES